jgi:hypothetical protein
VHPRKALRDKADPKLTETEASSSGMMERVAIAAPALVALLLLFPFGVFSGDAEVTGIEGDAGPVALPAD